MIFGWIFKRRPSTGDNSKEELKVWGERMSSLGYHRLNVLYCLSAHSPKSSCYFNPPPDVPVYDALRDHLERLFIHFSSGGPEGVLIFAAGLATYGRLDMAEFIISNLRCEPFFTDHYAGKCVVLPYAIASALLPLPEKLRRMASYFAVEWAAGTPEAAALQTWFAANRDRLVWDAKAEQFTLSQAPSAKE